VASVAVATFIGVLAKSNNIRWLFSPIYAVSYTGLGIILLGVIIRCIAVIQLKRCFTVDVGIVEGHNLMTSGLYRFIRHPSYLGTLITFLGCGISYVNWLCVIILIVPNVIWAVMRMNEEEQVLAAHFGADYQAYVMRTKRLLPFIY
jgi:protein-S-isoprenylcysteine O-methyltransferase Ste14